MGKVYISAKALLEDLDIDVVVPPRNTKETLEIGTKFSPETACLPLKILMGNYIQSIEKGAEAVVITGSCGPCRFGYYGVVQEQILRDLGYDIEILMLDPPKSKEDCKYFIDRLVKITGPRKVGDVVKYSWQAYMVNKACDELYEIALDKRPRELIKGSTDRLLHDFEMNIPKVRGSKATMKLIRDYGDKIKNLDEQDGFKPLNLGLVGEIYTLIEPFVNINIEQKLGNLGVRVYKNLTADKWVRNHIVPDIRFRIHEKRILKEGKPYLGLCIGGHAWQTVAHSVNYAKEGLDGIIQIMPFGCMPEIVAKSILPSVSRDKDIPIMTLVVDEMTGEGGYNTRLEAFVDLMSNKKEENSLNARALSRY